MKILLDDLPYNKCLYPLAQIKSLVHLKLGILTLYEKWNLVFPGNVFVASEIHKLNIDEEFYRLPANLLVPFKALHQFKKSKNTGDLIAAATKITRPWQLFQLNDHAINEDFDEITTGKKSQPIPKNTLVRNPENVFIAEGATVLVSVINAEAGPVYIGENATVMEGCLLRGPMAVCHGAVVKMGARIYGATTVGAQCVVGGEIKNSLIQDFSNKAHDGYLGDSVIGEWCNLGAGTSNSNIKNNASGVKVWAQETGAFESAGQKCGLLMGDYSKAAINTSFNTGTVVGAGCNIFAKEMPPKQVPNFSWGSEKYEWEKLLPDIENWKKLKGQSLSNEERETLRRLWTGIDE